MLSANKTLKPNLSHEEIAYLLSFMPPPNFIQGQLFRFEFITEEKKRDQFNLIKDEMGIETFMNVKGLQINNFEICAKLKPNGLELYKQFWQKYSSQESIDVEKSSNLESPNEFIQSDEAILTNFETNIIYQPYEIIKKIWIDNKPLQAKVKNLEANQSKQLLLKVIFNANQHFHRKYIENITDVNVIQEVLDFILKSKTFVSPRTISTLKDHILTLQLHIQKKIKIENTQSIESFNTLINNFKAASSEGKQAIVMSNWEDIIFVKWLKGHEIHIPNTELSHKFMQSDEELLQNLEFTILNLTAPYRNKIWEDNKRLLSLIKFLDPEKSKLLLGKVTSWSLSLFESYVQNIDDPNIIKHGLEYIESRSKNSMHNCILKNRLDVLQQSNVPVNIQSLNNKIKFFKTLSEKECVDYIIRIWNQNTLFPNWFKGQEIKYGSTDLTLSNEELIKIFEFSLILPATILEDIWKDNHRLHTLIKQLGRDYSSELLKKIINFCEIDFIKIYIKNIINLSVISNTLISLNIKNHFTIKMNNKIHIVYSLLSSRANELSPTNDVSTSTNLTFFNSTHQQSDALNHEIIKNPDFNKDGSFNKRKTNDHRFMNLDSNSEVSSTSALSTEDDDLINLIESTKTPVPSKNNIEATSNKKRKLNDPVMDQLTDEVMEEGEIAITPPSNTITTATENIKIKTEKNYEDELVSEHQPILKLNLQELDKVVKTLRGNSSETNYGCAVYARKIVDYLLTGILPTEAVSVNRKFNLAANFETISKARLCHRQIKTETCNDSNLLQEEDAILAKIQNNEDLSEKEISKMVMSNNASFINRNSFFGSYAPCHQIDMYEESNEGFDFKFSFYDLELALQKETNYLILNAKLQLEASENVNKVSFGIINISKCDKYVDKNPHVLVYYATPEKVYYIDAHGLDGKKQAGQYLLTKLTDRYEFADNPKKLTANTRSNVVHYLSIGPNLPEKTMAATPSLKK